MFVKLFQRKKKPVSDPCIPINIKDNENYKPIVYYSTDKNKYIITYVPDKINTKYTNYDRNLEQKSKKTIDYYEDINDIYDLYSVKDDLEIKKNDILEELDKVWDSTNQDNYQDTISLYSDIG
jgi:hypothetical protein